MMQLSLFDARRTNGAKPTNKPGLPPLTDELKHDYIGFLDEDTARENAVRLTVTGYSGSGKTTLLHNILSHALRERESRWSEVLILDGKQSTLSGYADLPHVTYYGPWDVGLWDRRLKQLSYVLMERFERQQIGQDPGRWLIVADEVQRGVRAKAGVGQSIRESLDLIAEQSDALGDVLIVTSQRELNAIPVSVRENCHGQLIMLADGYFYLSLKKGSNVSGRAPYISASDAVTLADSSAPFKPMTLKALPASLDSGLPLSKTYHPRVTLYLGEPGLGKTHTLLSRPAPEGWRTIYVNLALGARETLINIIEGARVVLPANTSLRTGELVELAALSIMARPTLLLLDNADQGELEMVVALEPLIKAAGEVVITANRPTTEAQREKMEVLYPRCEITALQPLTQADARELLWSVLDKARFKQPQAVERKILLEANGNPAHLVSLARRLPAEGEANLDHLYLHQMNRINLSWVLFLLLLGLLLALRRYVHDSFLVLVAISMGWIVLRRQLYRRR